MARIGEKGALTKIIRVAATMTLVGLGAACVTQMQPGVPAGTQEKIFETNVTNNLNVASGEPEIAVDPTNPQRLAIIEFDNGSARAGPGS